MFEKNVYLLFQGMCSGTVKLILVDSIVISAVHLMIFCLILILIGNMRMLTLPSPFISIRLLIGCCSWTV